MDGIVIQARMGSTRLPNKIMLPFFEGKRLIDILIMRIKAACPNRQLILATTEAEQDKPLLQAATEHGILGFAGSETDVLARFMNAAEYYGVERLIRVCSDNPFLQTDTFNILFKEHDRTPADYIAYAFADGTPTIKSHLGLYAELTTLDALRRVARTTEDLFYREHVTLYMYTHAREFDIRLLPLPKEVEGRRDLRLTMDTQSDFNMLQKLYAETQGEGDITALLRHIDANPKYRETMLTNIRANEK